MQIQSNNLLGATSKSIQFYNSCVIAKEGPHMASKLSLTNLDIDYDSIFTARQTLAVGSRDMPIMYGFLGTDITFLLIKPNYGDMNPQNCSGATQYLEYYFEDEPLVRRTMTDLLVLTGDDQHRIPQVYLYNPTDGIVTVEIMAANLDENTISTSLVPTYSELRGLSFSSIQTDEIYGIGCTGSTQFEIHDINGNIQMVIPYNKIDIIRIENELLTVVTRSADDVKLYFLSSFNALQALSRMNWAIEMSINRSADAIYPDLDTTAPVITFKTTAVPEPMPYVNGIVTQSAIRYKFIDTVIDYDDSGVTRDGLINPADVNLLIINTTSGEQATGITIDGNYSVTFLVRDLAGNSTNATHLIVVDDTGPTITYNSVVSTVAPYVVLSANTYMDLTGDTSTTGIITKDDIRTHYINYIWDDVDGAIVKSATTITLQSGATTFTSISGIGYYDMTISVMDYSSNETTATTNLYVYDSIPPEIFYNIAEFSGSAFTMSISGDTASGTGLTAADIRTYAILEVIDNYDGVIPNSNVAITGSTFPLDSPTGVEITFTVSDSSGNETTDTKYLIVTV